MPKRSHCGDGPSGDPKSSSRPGRGAENIRGDGAGGGAQGDGSSGNKRFRESPKRRRVGQRPIRYRYIGSDTRLRKSLTSISGVEFADCFARGEESEVDGEVVPFISYEDLKRNKRASGRAKDLADLDELD